MESSSSDGGNPFDFIPGTRFLPFEWRSLGPVLGSSASTTAPALSGRLTFLARSGFDALEEVPAGRIVEGSGEMGIAIRSQGLALALTTSNLTWRSGVDDPMQAQVVGESAVPSIKATIAARLGEEVHLGASWDIKLKRPELSLSWSGSTLREKATLVAVVDPISRSLRLAAAVSAPGPEWRKDLYDVIDDRVETPRDDGARHSLYVDHTSRRRDLLHRTTLGARLDLGRLLNQAAEGLEGHVLRRIPKVLWRVPLLPRLYCLLVPAQDMDQVRHRVRNWELDLSTSLGSAAAAATDEDGPLSSGVLGALGRPSVALRKTMRGVTLATQYAVVERTGTLSVSARGLTVGLVAQRPKAGQPWGRPAVMLSIEPLHL